MLWRTRAPLPPTQNCRVVSKLVLLSWFSVCSLGCDKTEKRENGWGAPQGREFGAHAAKRSQSVPDASRRSQTLPVVDPPDVRPMAFGVERLFEFFWISISREIETRGRGRPRIGNVASTPPKLYGSGARHCGEWVQHFSPSFNECVQTKQNAYNSQDAAFLN